MALSFPYEKIYETKFGPVFRPLVKVEFKIQENLWIGVWMIADTGADQTIIPRYLSEKLNIDLEKDCLKDKTFGVGGSQEIFMLKKRFPVRLGKWKKKIPLAVLDSDAVPPLMGRLGFMETFDALFSKKLKVVFKK